MYRLLQVSGPNIRFTNLTSFKNIYENVEMSSSRCQSCKIQLKFGYVSANSLFTGILRESVRNQSTKPNIERSPKKRRKRSYKFAELLVGMLSIKYVIFLF